MKTQNQTSKAINSSLWIAQSVLAVIFFLTGSMKLTLPIEKISEILPWAANAPEELIRFIGLSELLGAAGLILPAALSIKPFLTPLAAACLAIVMLAAAAFHFLRGEFSHIAVPVTMFLMSVFIVRGRTRMFSQEDTRPQIARVRTVSQ